MNVECAYCGEEIQRRCRGMQRNWQCFKCRQKKNRERATALFKSKMAVDNLPVALPNKKAEDKRTVFFLEAEQRLIDRENERENRLKASLKTLPNGIIGG